ncbi:hypothetical protein SUGI_0132540 [Cryptomeria japonica]|nr:hypothetical protein SUGI_0132540 [Cryptomeria japonica]
MEISNIRILTLSLAMEISNLRFDAIGMNMQRNIRFKAWREHQLTYKLKISPRKQKQGPKEDIATLQVSSSYKAIGSSSRHYKARIEKRSRGEQEDSRLGMKDFHRMKKMILYK